MRTQHSDLFNDLARDRMLDAARGRRNRRRLKHGLTACVPLALVATIALSGVSTNRPDGQPTTVHGGPTEESIPIWATPEDVPAVSDSTLLAALSEPDLPIWAGPSDHSPALDDQLLRALSD